MITAPDTVTNSETDPISDEQQQNHYSNNKFHKELSQSSKEKGRTNSILVTNSENAPKQDLKQQKHDDKQKSRPKELCENRKEESSNTTTNASVEEQLLLSLTGKRKKNITNINKTFAVMVMKKMQQ